jgi:uncharacterized protein (TIGR00369 family)
MSIPPFNTYLGTEILVREKGRAEVALELAPHHLNRRGVAHGGVITALLDSALGAAVISSMPAEWWCATTNLNTQFVDGAGSGRLVAHGEVVRRGRHVAFARGEVRDAGGRLIATATGSWHLWSRKPPRKDRAAGRWVVLQSSGERIGVGKILAVGRNYADHVAEMKAPRDGGPVMFFKPPSALLHDGGTLTLPQGGGEVHHEVEMVVAIGEPGRTIAVSRALDHVLGYAVGLDLTLREVQAEAKRRGEPWSVAKGFDGSAPVSGVVPRDDVGDGSGLELSLHVNGELRQRGNTSQMLHPVPELVALASRWLTLERGDLLFTGTPAGVGPLAPGDRLEARLERVGTLRIGVEAPKR